MTGARLATEGREMGINQNFLFISLQPQPWAGESSRAKETGRALPLGMQMEGLPW